MVDRLVEAAAILDGRTAIKDSGREDSEAIVDSRKVGRSFKDGRETDEAVREFPVKFRDKGFNEELVSLVD